MNSGPDVPRNVEAAERLVRAAAAEGAELVALPEKWPLLGPGELLREHAQRLDGPVVGAVRAWARELGVHVLAGSFTEDAGRGERPFNTSALIAPDGSIVATYRKLHMFDVDVGGTAYRESEHEQPGDALTTAPVGRLCLGLTVCYDLRFPELFRILALRGAEAFAVPSAFTATTGRDHWDVLLRARAIENAAFVIAPNQVGAAPPHYESWGHSAIVGPWGDVLASLPEGEGHAVADLDLGEVARVRESLPALANRRGDAYAWPQGAPA